MPPFLIATLYIIPAYGYNQRKLTLPQRLLYLLTAIEKHIVPDVPSTDLLHSQQAIPVAVSIFQGFPGVFFSPLSWLTLS